MMEVKKNEKYLLWGILLIGFFLRLFLLGRFPAGGAVNVDEATAGYEAYSMLRTGADYTGYVHPMYFYSWGSGMNVLESYCQMPFIAVFGLTAFAVRIPQALLGCITLPAFYELTRRIQNRRFALLSVFLLSVMPWHIMISRWALESNFLPGFLVIAALFLAMSTENSRWFPVSMLFYGLSLYCYAAAWTVMPLIILGPILYLLFSKRLKIDRWILTGAILFCVLAVPVFLLFMVNTGIIGEIRTGFLSVPRMYHFRNSEVAVSPAVFMKRLAASVKMFLRQDDGNVWNFASGYGIYYHFSIFFIVTGLIVSAYSFIRKREAHGLSCIMLCQLAAGILLCGMIDANFNRVNIIHIPLIYYCAVGISFICRKFGEWIKYPVILAYSVSLLLFSVYYYSDYDVLMKEAFHDGMKDAVEFTSENGNGSAEVHFLSNIPYSIVLFYTRYDPQDFRNTVVYSNDSSDMEIPLQFGSYDYRSCVSEDGKTAEPEAVPDDFYICRQDDEQALQFMKDNNMDMKNFDTVIVGVGR